MVNLWVTPDDLGAASTSPYAYEACQTASFILWALSGRKFHGTIATTETYECPPCESSWVFPTLINGNIVNVPYGRGVYVGCFGHAHLRLRGRPVTSVQEVNLGGTVLPASSYWIENKAVLAVDTQHSLCGVQVSYTYGVRPPMAGRRAARYLALQFILSWEGSEECELPQSVTSVTRQGVQYQLLDNNTLIDDLRTGVYSVDLFLKAVNPDNARKPARVFSPDLPRAKKISRHLPLNAQTGPHDLQIIPGRAYTWTVNLAEVGVSLFDGTSYQPRGQISTWNGATVREYNEDNFEFIGGNLRCTLTAEDTRAAGLIGQGVWDLYAVSAADPNTIVHLLTSNIWLTSQNATQTA